jgi:hypothetical protein
MAHRGRKKTEGVDSPASPRQDRSVPTQLAELERKFAALTTQLEEKVEQNITLMQQADLDMKLILDIQEVDRRFDFL